MKSNPTTTTRWELVVKLSQSQTTRFPCVCPHPHAHSDGRSHAQAGGQTLPNVPNAESTKQSICTPLCFDTPPMMGVHLKGASRHSSAFFPKYLAVVSAEILNHRQVAPRGALSILVLQAEVHGIVRTVRAVVVAGNANADALQLDRRWRWRRRLRRKIRLRPLPWCDSAVARRIRRRDAIPHRWCSQRLGLHRTRHWHRCWRWRWHRSGRNTAADPLEIIACSPR